MAKSKSPKKSADEKESAKVSRAVMNRVRKEATLKGYSISGFLETAAIEKLDRLKTTK